MKQILFLLTLGSAAAVNAQQIKLDKGQRITITSTVSQDMDMGMGMQMKNSSNTTSVLEVKDADSKNYNTVYKLTKLNMTFDGMGQQQSYDSEKATDKDSELGKSVGDKIGKEVNVTIDKNTGEITTEKKAEPEKDDEDEDNPLAGMMDMFGAKESETAITESVFFLIPAGKKVGDSWSDSVNVKESMKGIKTFTLKAINGNEATIALFSKIEGKQNVEMQGMQIDINISAKTEGEMLVNTKTSLVKKSSRVADISGNMDLMGQSMPLTSKMTEVTEYK